MRDVAYGRESPVAESAMGLYRLVLASGAALVTGPIVVWLGCAAVVLLGTPLYLFFPWLGVLGLRLLASLFQMAFLETLRDNAVLCFLALPVVSAALRRGAGDRALVLSLAGGLGGVTLALHGGGGGGTALAGGFGGLAAGHAYALASAGAGRPRVGRG